MSLSNERFYPATPDETLQALTWAVADVGRLKSVDEFARAVTFSTMASGFSWGAQMNAYVIPESEGALVRVVGTQNLRTNVTAGGAEFRNTAKVLDGVGRHIQGLREERASGGGVEKVGTVDMAKSSSGLDLRWWSQKLGIYVGVAVLVALVLLVAFAGI